MDRRAFLQTACIGAAAAAELASPRAEALSVARPPRPMPPQALGILYDSTLCIGCKACMAACKRANHVGPEPTPPDLAAWNEGTWDTARDLSGTTLNIIKVYQNGTMAVKDRAVDGYAFIKRHCLHCVDPSCVSACPVSAMEKDAETGIVAYHPDRCIGCRYCVYACPFGVPRFQLNRAFGQIRKCELCRHLVAEGGFAACCDVCPTGASLFGPVTLLREEAHRRLAKQPGELHSFPRGRIDGDRPPHERPIAQYQPHLYGEAELGGTQVLYLAGVSFGALGLPEGVPDVGYPAVSEGLQELLYQGMTVPAALFAALLYFVHRSQKQHATEEGDGDRRNNHSSGNSRNQGSAPAGRAS